MSENADAIGLARMVRAMLQAQTAHAQRPTAETSKIQFDRERRVKEAVELLLEPPRLFDSRGES